ncbi:MAG TPA: LacI family DNA-binding transcriptional regulator [Kiritimatiellia bacterium]|nr:LacI family DNA-binding transcriptional regulator [Kiritimatiellia bacterium]
MNIPKRVTIGDIAKESGFSQSTVSLVLNNNPRISDDTRQKVLQAIEKHGYKPNIHARGLAMRSSRVISVVLPDIPNVFGDPYFGALLSGVYTGVAEAGLKMLVDLANMNFIRTQEYFNILDTRQADGMIFLGTTNYDQYLSGFKDKGYSMLLVNNHFPKWGLSHVSMDYRHAAKLAAEHLLGLGHRKIGIITGTNVQAAVDFLDTVEETFRSAGISAEDSPWADGRFNEQVGFEAARVVMTLNPEITAILCGNDLMALGALRYVYTQGLTVPKDVSIVGVEDLPLAQLTTPKLTTVRHDLHDLGRLAVRQILAMNREETDSVGEWRQGMLVERESTAGPRGV